MSRIDNRVTSMVQFPRLIATVLGSLLDDTGESGDAYEAEAKSEALARAQTAY